MLPFFEQLQQATVLKRFLDEFQKNPGRTIFALIVVACLSSAGAHVAFGDPGSRSAPLPLSELPYDNTPPNLGEPLSALPEAEPAESALKNELKKNERRNQAFLDELSTRPDGVEITEREIDLLNESGNVTY